MNQTFYKTILDSLYDGVYVVDHDRSILYWNKGAERISGYSADEVVGRHCADNLLRHIDEAGLQLCRGMCPLAHTLRDGQPREDTVYLHHKQGHRVPIAVRIAPLRDESGAITAAVEVFSDISASKSILCELDDLRSQTLRDPLTGLGNRRAAEEEFQRRGLDLQRYRIPFGFFFVDVDHFKTVNDAYGHETGDRALVMIAKTLVSALRGVDKVCRWGGEEFLVIVPKIDAGKLAAVGERIRRFVQSSGLPLPTGGELTLTVSIGGVMAEADDSLDSLVARADARMYEAKRGGRNRCVLDCGGEE